MRCSLPCPSPTGQGAGFASTLAAPYPWSALHMADSAPGSPPTETVLVSRPGIATVHSMLTPCKALTIWYFPSLPSSLHPSLSSFLRPSIFLPSSFLLSSLSFFFSPFPPPLEHKPYKNMNSCAVHWRVTCPWPILGTWIFSERMNECRQNLAMVLRVAKWWKTLTPQHTIPALQRLTNKWDF